MLSLLVVPHLFARESRSAVHKFHFPPNGIPHRNIYYTPNQYTQLKKGVEVWEFERDGETWMAIGFAEDQQKENSHTAPDHGTHHPHGNGESHDRNAHQHQHQQHGHHPKGPITTIRTITLTLRLPVQPSLL